MKSRPAGRREERGEERKSKPDSSAAGCTERTYDPATAHVPYDARAARGRLQTHPFAPSLRRFQHDNQPAGIKVGPPSNQLEPGKTEPGDPGLSFWPSHEEEEESIISEGGKAPHDEGEEPIARM
jgi:hypothetical protein